MKIWNFFAAPSDWLPCYFAVLRDIPKLGCTFRHIPMPASMQHINLRRSVALLSCAMLSLSSAWASFSVDEIRRGVTEGQFKTAMEKRGYRIAGTESSNMWWVYEPANNDMIATYRTCRGRIYEQALAAAGGHGAFIKRVAQFTREFGAAEYSAESSVVEQGERNMLDFTWRRTDEVVTVTFFAAAGRVAERQWVSRAVPSVCNQ